MGVRGLTTFIARHAELYLKPYELHDCNLVIDGDNLACNLFKDAAGVNSAFGGDYDYFYRTVVEFFQVLKECNITPYVLMDGGYKKNKLRTVWQRLRGKICVIKKIDPVRSLNIFPLMMREVFVDALKDCGVPVMRCVFEADDELAALAKKLNCPVLSYDSDFYIHNVKYIPLVTLTVKAHKKKISQKSQEKTKLSKSNAKHLEKLTKSHKIIKDVQVEAEDKKAPKTGQTYKYLDCCLYKIEHLIARGSLSKDKLPLFAVLLGNDYIPSSAFKTFFSQMKQTGMRKRSTRLHKRIVKILQWLKHETVDSALDKILVSLKKPERDALLARIKGAVEGYCSETCDSYEYFKAHYEIDEERTGGDAESDDDSDEDVEEDEDQVEEVEKVDNDQVEEVVDEDEEEEENKTDVISDEEEIDNDFNEDNETDPSAFLPDWFKNRLYSANLPRFLVDMAHLRIYINNPQIEHFQFKDCNEIGIPILRYIFCLLYHVSGFDEDKVFRDRYTQQENYDEFVPYLRYLTRLTLQTNVHTVRYPLEPPPDISFYPTEFDPKLLKIVFSKLNPGNDKLFEEIERIPSDLQLYFLAMVYWMYKTPHANLLHLHALLICLVVLRVVDSKVEPIRDGRAFHKRYGNIVKKEKLARSKDDEQEVKQIDADLQSLPILDRVKQISPAECILVQDNLLKHFHIQEVFSRKYDDFSTIVLHGFAEFQSVVFNLHALNGLLGNIYESPKMAKTYCGLFIYNIYDLLRSRIDVNYFIQNHIFQYSPMLFELYEFFWTWFQPFIPEWQVKKTAESTLVASKNVLKKRKSAAKKREKAAAKLQEKTCEAKESMDSTAEGEDQDFYDLNNKFGALLKCS